MVIDFGGSATDISIVETKQDEFVVKAINVDQNLGGENIDIAIMDHLLAKCREQFG